MTSYRTRSTNFTIRSNGNVSITGTEDGGYEVTIDDGHPVKHFIEEGRKGMKLWRKVMDGCKYLVIRRDGTVPAWPHFVMSARDPYAPAALRAYADQAEALGSEGEYVASIRELAGEFEAYRDEHGSGDPEAGPHRTDDPGIVGVMRDGLGGRVFITAAWDADQLARETEKAKEGPDGC